MSPFEGHFSIGIGVEHLCMHVACISPLLPPSALDPPIPPPRPMLGSQSAPSSLPVRVPDPTTYSTRSVASGNLERRCRS
eukprot:1195038-Prorocentrum_minimum.AAC.6